MMFVRWETRTEPMGGGPVRESHGHERPGSSVLLIRSCSFLAAETI